MDSTEVAVRFTEAIMSNSSVARTIKGADLAETYVNMFAEVLTRVNDVMNPPPPMPAPPPASRATSDVFPLTHDRQE